MRKLYKNSDDAERRLPTQSAATPAWASLRSLCSLSRSLSCLSLRRIGMLPAMSHGAWIKNVELDWPQRRVAALQLQSTLTSRCCCILLRCQLPKVFNCFNWQHVIRQFESCQSLGHDFASRQAGGAAWACSQTGTERHPLWPSVWPDWRIWQLLQPTSYRFIALSTVGERFVALATLQVLLNWRVIDLSIYRLINLSIYQFIDLPSSSQHVCAASAASQMSNRCLRRRRSNASCSKKKLSKSELELEMQQQK